MLAVRRVQPNAASRRNVPRGLRPYMVVFPSRAAAPGDPADPGLSTIRSYARNATPPLAGLQWKNGVPGRILRNCSSNFPGSLGPVILLPMISARFAPLCIVFVLAVAPSLAHSKPVLFPPLPDGRQEVREESDVAPYLAAWKAAAMARERAAATPATANQQQYDVTWYDLN